MKLIKVRCKDGNGYKFFVVVESGGKKLLESGWASASEAKDMVKELPSYLLPRMEPLARLSTLGLDPKNKQHWLKG